MKIILPSNDLIQNWWRNKKLLRQAKVKRIQHHQTSFTTNIKQTYIVRKYKRRKRSTKNKHQTIKKMAIGIYVCVYVCVYIYIYNYFKIKLIKCSSQKTQTSWINTKIRPIFFPHRSVNKESAWSAGDLGVIPWVRKMPCRRKWQPSPVSLSENS